VQAYRFLRRVENRLQMLRAAQTHVLPEDALDRTRIALGLGYADWTQLYAALQVQRDRVAAEFAELLAPRVQALAPDALTRYWRGLPDQADTQVLAAAGFADVDGADQSLRGFVQLLGVHSLSDAARARLDRVLPALLHAAARAAGRCRVAPRARPAVGDPAPRQLSRVARRTAQRVGAAG